MGRQAACDGSGVLRSAECGCAAVVCVCLQKQELGKDACQPQGFYGPLTKDDVKVRSPSATAPNGMQLSSSTAWLGRACTSGGGRSRPPECAGLQRAQARVLTGAGRCTVCAVCC